MKCFVTTKPNFKENVMKPNFKENVKRKSKDFELNSIKTSIRRATATLSADKPLGVIELSPLHPLHGTTQLQKRLKQPTELKRWPI